MEHLRFMGVHDAAHANLEGGASQQGHLILAVHASITNCRVPMSVLSSVSMAGPLLALEDEAPLVAVMSCFIVTSSSPRISLVGDPIPLTQHVCGLMKRVALVSLHPHVLVLWQDTLCPLHSSPVLHASCPCTCPSDWLGDDCQPWHILDNQDRTSFPNLS